MRTLYFTRDYTTHDHRFLTALAQTGHKIHYLRLERRGHQLEDRALPPQIEIVPWAGGRGPVSFRDGFRLLTDLKRVIRKLKPDLIQAGPLQTTAFLVALTGFRPLVSMSWGYDLLQDANRNPFWRWATRYTLKHSAVMVGDCDTIRQKAIFYGIANERVVTFPWGVDINHFSPIDNQQPPLAEDDQISWQEQNPDNFMSLEGDAPPFVLLSTRGWEPIYGVDVIAHAFVQAAKQRPELRLLMLGNGTQAAQLRQIFIQGGVLDQVYFPGQVSQTNLPRYYRAADLYVSASHSDGTSISMLEAMACGCPVLLSDIPGNREWVELEVQGWWFSDGDAGALTQAILHAADERDHLPEMGRAARLLVEQRADWEKNFQELLKAYELALQATRQ